MRGYMFLVFVVIYFISVSCAKKPDNTIESKMSEKPAESYNAADPAILNAAGDTNARIDTEAIRKKAREEFEQLNKEHLRKYEESEIQSEKKSVELFEKNK